MRTKEATKSQAHEKHDVHEDLAQTNKVSFTVIIVLGALVGIWGFSCLIISLMKYGIGGVVGGLIAAITGK